MKIVQFTLNNQQKQLTLIFDNSHQFSFSFEYLRVFTPSQTKSKSNSATPEIFHKKDVRLLRIEPLGKHGHRLLFDDQHSAIFTDEIFKKLYNDYEKNWQSYCDNLTSSQNREASINFVEVK